MVSKVTEDKNPWYIDAFGEAYLRLYPRRNAELTRRETEFAIETLELERTERVLDLCCGAGHHLKALRERRLNALGVDLSCELLNRAKENGPIANSDMRSIPHAGDFDAVLTFFTTIGYFDDAENEIVLHEIARILKPDGRFLIDYLNPRLVRDTLEPTSTVKKDDLTLHSERKIEGSPPRVTKHVQITNGSEVLSDYTESVRLYELNEFEAMLERAGLAVDAVWGDFDSSGYSETSPRMIFTGHKIAEKQAVLWKGSEKVFRQIKGGHDRNFAYLIADNKDGAVIDPIEPEQLLELAKEHGIKIKYIINTHGHFDHTDGNAKMKEATGAQVLSHRANIPHPKDVVLEGGEEFELGGTSFKILHTPGHTDDSVCILWENRLMTGDTLFVGKVGGTSFDEEAREEYHSLREVIAPLPPQTEIWPGHDYGSEPSSTIAHELKTNPFYKQPDFESFIRLKKHWLEYKLKHNIK